MSLSNFAGLVLFLLVVGLIYWLWKRQHPPLPPPPDTVPLFPSLNLAVYVDGILQEGSTMFTATIAQLIALSAIFKDALGNVTTPAPGAQVVWSVSDSSLADIEVSEDTLSARLVPVGPLGVVTVTAVAGDLTAEPVQITLTAGVAVSLEIGVSITDPT